VSVFTPCSHGFEPKVCPTCQEPVLRYQSVADARRLAKALEVVTEAREAVEVMGMMGVYLGPLVAALAAFDEVTK
jgi:hypothetical protein